MKRLGIAVLLAVLMFALSAASVHAYPPSHYFFDVTITDSRSFQRATWDGVQVVPYPIGEDFPFPVVQDTFKGAVWWYNLFIPWPYIPKYRCVMDISDWDVANDPWLGVLPFPLRVTKTFGVSIPQGGYVGYITKIYVKLPYATSGTYYYPTRDQDFYQDLGDGFSVKVTCSNNGGTIDYVEVKFVRETSATWGFENFYASIELMADMPTPPGRQFYVSSTVRFGSDSMGYAIGYAWTEFYLEKRGQTHYSWVSPTGFNDPYNRWANEPNAYDENTETYADWWYIFPDTPPMWTHFLELTHSALVSNKVRFWASGYDGYPPLLVDIDVYDGSWHHVYQGSFTPNTWVEKSFSQLTITKMRLRFYLPDFMYLSAYLHEADFWQTS